MKMHNEKHDLESEDVNANLENLSSTNMGNVISERAGEMVDPSYTNILPNSTNIEPNFTLPVIHNQSRDVAHYYDASVLDENFKTN